MLQTTVRPSYTRGMNLISSIVNNHPPRPHFHFANHQSAEIKQGIGKFSFSVYIPETEEPETGIHCSLPYTPAKHNAAIYDSRQGCCCCQHRREWTVHGEHIRMYISKCKNHLLKTIHRVKTYSESMMFIFICVEVPYRTF